VCRVSCPIQHTTSDFRDEPFQTIDCTSTDNQNKETKQKHKRQTEKSAVANKTNYAFYDLQPGNRVGPILTIPEPPGGNSTRAVKYSALQSYSTVIYECNILSKVSSMCNPAIQRIWQPFPDCAVQSI